MYELTEQEIQRLDSYLLGHLDEDGITQIATRIENDASWKAAYEMRKHVQGHARNAFHSRMKERFTAIDKQRGSTGRTRQLWFAIAASVLLLVSALAWFVIPTKSGSQVLAMYKEFPNLVDPIQKSGETPTAENPFHAYERGNFVEAIRIFEESATPSQAEQVYHGLSYMRQEQWGPADQVLAGVMTGPEQRWRDVAEWYRAWIQYHTGATIESRASFERIAAQREHRYQAQADTLIDLLQDK